jgi:hypothetical protein
VTKKKFNVPVFTLYFSTRLRLDQPTDNPPARITSVELESSMILINLMKIYKNSTCIEEIIQNLVMLSELSSRDGLGQTGLAQGINRIFK